MSDNLDPRIPVRQEYVMAEVEQELNALRAELAKEQEINRASGSIFGDKLGALRTENAMLRQDVIDLAKGYENRIIELHAENEHLKQEMGELTDLYTTYRGVFHDGVLVADVISAIRKQLAEARAENERLRAVIDAYLENDSQANWDAMAEALNKCRNV